MDVEIVNKLYELYLMLLGGYVFLLIFTIGYVIAIFRLYRNVNVILEEVNNKGYYDKSINN